MLGPSLPGELLIGKAGSDIAPLLQPRPTSSTEQRGRASRIPLGGVAGLPGRPELGGGAGEFQSISERPCRDVRQVPRGHPSIALPCLRGKSLRGDIGFARGFPWCPDFARAGGLLRLRSRLGHGCSLKVRTRVCNRGASYLSLLSMLMGSPVGGTDALAKMPCRALRRLGARRVRLRGGWTATGAERALSARRSSRHQRNALTGERARAPGRSSAGRSHWC